MVQIISKRKKDNAKSRRMRERGEHYAAYKAACDEGRVLAGKIALAFAKLSGEASPRVQQALSTPGWREPKDASSSACLPQVALYSAGHRKSENITAR